MLDFTFESLFTSGGITLGNFLWCIGTALALGIFSALVRNIKNPASKSFTVTLAMLPAIVSVVIMMVGGNLGAGVAVAGTFSLVRFRSAPGTAREICDVFLSMAIGLACGMGHPLLAVVFAVVMCVVSILFAVTNFGGGKQHRLSRVLKITVPEDLDYTGIFDDLMERYTVSHTLQSVKTTNLGSLNKLTYEIVLRTAGTEKAFLDELRCRNGNLEISISVLITDPRDL